MKIKWMTLENSEATATLKQHAFIEKICKVPVIGDKYIGNTMLCRKGGCSSDGDRYDNFSTLTDEGLNEKIACKKCLKKLKNAEETKPEAQ
jgi:hypothetical protein